VNLERIVMEEQETHPDRYKKNADGAKDNLGWRDT